MSRLAGDFKNVDVFFKDSICTNYRKVGETSWKKGIFVAEGEFLYFSDIVIRAENAMIYVNGNEYVPKKGDQIVIEGEGTFQIVDVVNTYGIYVCDLRKVQI